MLLQVKPINFSSMHNNITLSMKCIPKDFLENNSFDELKTLCGDSNQNIYTLKSKIVNGFKKDNNIIIFNYCDSPDITFLDILMDNIKNNFTVIKNNLKLFDDNLMIFNLHKIEQYGWDKSILNELITDCIALINEQFIYNLQKRTANILVRNYLQYRYNPKYGYCRYIVNKQYDEMMVN